MVKRSAARTDFLANILVTIVEGGSDYWANFEDYKWSEDDQHNMTGASVAIFDREEPQNGWKDVTLDTIALGIGIIRQHPDSIAAAKEILEASRENDAGNIDSCAADGIVQMALFGELVYG